MAYQKTRTDTLRIAVAENFNSQRGLDVAELLRSVARYYGGSDWRVVEGTHRGGHIEIARDVDYVDVSEDIHQWAKTTYAQLQRKHKLAPLYVASVYHGLADFTHMQRWMDHIAAAHRQQNPGRGFTTESRAEAVAELITSLIELMEDPHKTHNGTLSWMRQRLLDSQDMRQGSVALNGTRTALRAPAYTPVPTPMAPQALRALPETATFTHFALSQMECSTKDAYDTVWRRDSVQWWASGFGRAFHKLGDLLEDRHLEGH